MPPKATGSIFRCNGKIVGVRVSMPDGSRPLVAIKPEVMAQIEI